MLLKLLSNQITQYWSLISMTIKASLPPSTSLSVYAETELYKRLLIGVFQCWVGTESDFKPKAIALTTIISDPGTGDRSLLIYSLYSFSLVSNSEWSEWLEGLKKFAEAEGCKTISAYSNVPRANLIAQNAGGEISQFIKFKVR